MVLGHARLQTKEVTTAVCDLCTHDVNLEWFVDFIGVDFSVGHLVLATSVRRCAVLRNRMHDFAIL